MQDKMTRMPRPELIELIFSCFRRQEHWSLTALREYTQQPVVYLKEVLNEVCTYNKKVHTPRGLLRQRSRFSPREGVSGACALLTSRTGRSAVATGRAQEHIRAAARVSGGEEEACCRPAGVVVVLCVVSCRVATTTTTMQCNAPWFICRNMYIGNARLCLLVSVEEVGQAHG